MNRHINKRKIEVIMSIFVFLIFSLSLMAGCHKSDQEQGKVDVGCLLPLPDSIKNLHVKSAALQQLIDSLTKAGVPGMSLTIHEAGQGWFAGSAGWADIDHKKAFLPCQISRAGSTVKMLTAISVLQLAEAGKVDLDKLIKEYLPASPLDKIENADKATVRQLLNHSSGIYNYIQDAQFQLASLNELTKTWQTNELLSYARGRKAYFAAGSDVRYSNTNYILLGMLIEKASGISFPQYFKQNIFDRLQLKHTRFDINNPVPADLARGYTDWYNKHQILESTWYNGWDYYTADGGLQSTPTDLVLLVEGLFANKLINAASLQLMLTTEPYTKAEDFYPINYGLGIFKVQTPYGMAWFHSGDAIGYFATVMYFPGKKLTVSWMTNGNYGFIDPLINTEEAFTRILKTVF